MVGLLHRGIVPMKNEHNKPAQAELCESYEYQVDEKRVFIVTPIYFAETQKLLTIFS